MYSRFLEVFTKSKIFTSVLSTLPGIEQLTGGVLRVQELWNSNCFHDACRFLGKEDWLTIQMEVGGERLSSLFVRAVLGFLAVKDQ